MHSGYAGSGCRQCSLSSWVFCRRLPTKHDTYYIFLRRWWYHCIYSIFMFVHNTSVGQKSKLSSDALGTLQRRCLVAGASHTCRVQRRSWHVFSWIFFRGILIDLFAVQLPPLLGYFFCFLFGVESCKGSHSDATVPWITQAPARPHLHIHHCCTTFLGLKLYG